MIDRELYADLLQFIFLRIAALLLRSAFRLINKDSKSLSLPRSTIINDEVAIANATEAPTALYIQIAKSLPAGRVDTNKNTPIKIDSIV